MLPRICSLSSELHPSIFSLTLYLLHTISFSPSCAPPYFCLHFFPYSSYFTLIMLSMLVCDSQACVIMFVFISMCVHFCVHVVCFRVICALLVGCLSVGVPNVQCGCWCIFNYMCTYVCGCTNLWLCMGGLIYLASLSLSLSICDFHCAIFRMRELGLHFIRPIWLLHFFLVCVFLLVCTYVFSWVAVYMDLLADLCFT